MIAAMVGAFAQSAVAQNPSSAIGVVIMHGKGGSPTRFVAGLASFLEQKGYLVANLEMPWSGSREYNATVEAAEKEVDAAIDSLRAKGAVKVFVAGHSQGGLFAIYYGGKHPVDGIIAIAPGGNVATPIYRREVGPSVEQARRLIADGKGNVPKTRPVHGRLPARRKNTVIEDLQRRPGIPVARQPQMRATQMSAGNPGAGLKQFAPIIPFRRHQRAAQDPLVEVSQRPPILGDEICVNILRGDTHVSSSPGHYLPDFFAIAALMRRASIPISRSMPVGDT